MPMNMGEDEKFPKEIVLVCEFDRKLMGKCCKINGKRRGGRSSNYNGGRVEKKEKRRREKKIRHLSEWLLIPC
jgi:hypothetical protein